MICAGGVAEGDVGFVQTREVVAGARSELPCRQIAGAARGQLLPVPLDAARPDDDDRERADLAHWITLPRLAEDRETHEDPVGRGHADVRSLRPTGLFAGRALQLELGLEPAVDGDDGVLRVLDRVSLGDELTVPQDDLVERPDRRQLAVVRLVSVEERDVEAGVHPF